MKQSFFFYDLETSGINPRTSRIMQFAGVRTDLHLQPLQEEHNYLIKLTEDILPEPDAVLITGITPQKTIADGKSEAEFLKIFYKEIAVPGTIFVGFNTIRFDDEFMRFLMYRNFYDPYEWQWQDERSRWDLLDVVRMTRALRPDGIKWPFDSLGKSTNRLEMLTSLNNLEHTSAHDALSDVYATIAVARLIREKQPKLFDYLASMRHKNEVESLVQSGQPFVYTSGKYSNEHEKTTVVSLLTPHPQTGSIVFDLRYDPEEVASLSSDDMLEALQRRYNDPGPRLPIKTLKYNRCPAIAPMTVLDENSQVRLSIDTTQIKNNHTKLQAHKKQIIPKLLRALEQLDKKQQLRLMEDPQEVDVRLYEGFFTNQDKQKMSVVRAASFDDLSDLELEFQDDRLSALLPLYKARNYPQALSDDERGEWEKFRERRLLSGGEQSHAAKYFQRLSELSTQEKLSPEKQYLLEELQLYGQSILPDL